MAAAIALRRVGVETLVLEQAAAIREVGAGLSLWSNAVVALRGLPRYADRLAELCASRIGIFVQHQRLSEMAMPPVIERPGILTPLIS
jgi:2-polyprenyl-6-methoxyphenol hydroxylase-like FAD-dependent oxidoreductase